MCTLLYIKEVFNKDPQSRELRSVLCSNFYGKKNVKKNGYMYI